MENPDPRSADSPLDPAQRARACAVVVARAALDRRGDGLSFAPKPEVAPLHSWELIELADYIFTGALPALDNSEEVR